ncbi:chromogranin-A [Anoplopoma fimbria]|uniref:chromogranin-A n=1 Tax=Anoplopoma fimbria TaxID=229290 RepID=UPI0023EB7145|nr:chromogranin-A [Anoplopoma fimbria]
MMGRGLFVLTILSNCALSLPVTHSQLENEDVKVMKCIVEALADVLSRPHPMPVSQECLVTLKTDDRLVSILRHQNFLKVLQDIAVQGHQERAQHQRDAGTSEQSTQTPQAADDVADRSMLEALGGPGEQSILSQKKRTGNGDGEEEKEDSLVDGESQDDNGVIEEVKEKRENDKSPGSHISASVEEWREGKAEKREEEEGEDYDEKRANSEEEHMIKDKKGAGFGEKRDAPRIKSKEKKFDEEDEEEKDKRSAYLSHRPKQEVEKEEEEDEGEMKRESKESHKRWTKRGKSSPMKKKAVGNEAQQEVPHHSREVAEEEEEEEKKKKRNPQRSPEEKELQMIARGGPEERRGSEEEGSASRKSEEPEIESLAAIESELEDVAQKLHEMRRG